MQDNTCVYTEMGTIMFIALCLAQHGSHSKEIFIYSTSHIWWV